MFAMVCRYNWLETDRMTWKTILSRCTASVAVVAIWTYASVVVSGQPHKLLRIPLYKQQQPSMELPHRLAHQQARAHRRALEEAGIINVTFAWSESSLGVGYGTHYAEIYLGIPAQRASVIVDTGSHLTALPCSTCTGCGQHTDPIYDVSKSTTAAYLACHDFDSCRSCEQDRCYISQSYTEGSMWEAVMVDELVWVGGLSSHSGEMDEVLKTFGFRFPVGCQTKETGLFITQKENGIMGLGRHHSTVMSYMLKAGRVTHDLFTLCFASDGGELVFGGVDYSHHTSAVAYTPLLKDSFASYPVHVRDILVNGVSLGIDDKTINSGKGVIVDSGTTDTFFAAKGNRRFMRAFERAAGGLDYTEQRMKLSDKELQALPIISIVLSGMKGDGSDDVQLDLPASKYLTIADDGGSYSSNVHFSERSGGVLGAGIMIGLDVIFDTENNRVGFADSHCGKRHRNTSRVSLDTADQRTSETSTPIASTTVPNDSIDITTSLSAGLITRQASSNIGAFIANVILISLIGVALGVVIWAKWRMRAWSRIPSSAPPADIESMLTSNEIENQTPLSSSSEGSPLRAARKAWSPTFTIGPNREDDDDE